MGNNNTVKIFIASSAEVSDERKNCIVFLNQINKSHPHLRLEPLEWEYDIVHGSYPDFAGVQKAINPLLEPSKLCIFIFYSKIGKYTLEEFTLATELKKKIIPFFKKGFSPETDDEIVKWKELLTFKNGMNQNVLYIEYSSDKDFEIKLKDNLHLYLAQEYPPLTLSENQPYSNETAVLIKILSEKQEEIEKLKNANLALPTSENSNQLAQAEREIINLKKELEQNKEILAKQARDKKELEKILNAEIDKPKLKQLALQAIEEKNFDKADNLLQEAAKDRISEVADDFYQIGIIKELKLEFNEALKYFDLAAIISPSNPEYLNKAGQLNMTLGNLRKAIKYTERALRIDLELYGEFNSNTAGDYNSLGMAWLAKGDLDKAIEYAERALKIDLELYGEFNPNTAICCNNLGQAWLAKGDLDKAIEYTERALKIDLELYGEFNSNTAICYNNLGQAWLAKGDLDKAIKYTKLALKIDLENYGEINPNTARDYNNLGVAWQAKGDLDKAIEFTERALKIDLEVYGEINPNTSRDYNNLVLS